MAKINYKEKVKEIIDELDIPNNFDFLKIKTIPYRMDDEFKDLDFYSALKLIELSEVDKMTHKFVLGYDKKTNKFVELICFQNMFKETGVYDYNDLLNQPKYIMCHNRVEIDDKYYEEIYNNFKYFNYIDTLKNLVKIKELYNNRYLLFRKDNYKEIVLIKKPTYFDINNYGIGKVLFYSDISLSNPYSLLFDVRLYSNIINFREDFLTKIDILSNLSHSTISAMAIYNYSLSETMFNIYKTKRNNFFKMFKLKNGIKTYQEYFSYLIDNKLL